MTDANDPPPCPYPRTRALRGLLRRVRDGSVAPHGRVLVGVVASRGKPVRTCVWCGTGCGPGRRWHDDCVVAYLVARGATTHVGTGVPLIPYRVCAECGADARCEVDHDVALSVARERGVERWWRAWTVGNLRALCPGCHRAKTRRDRRLLAQLQRRDPQQGELLGGVLQAR